MYFDQLLLAARKAHVVYSDQLLGAALCIHFISNHDKMFETCCTTIHKKWLYFRGIISAALVKWVVFGVGKQWFHIQRLIPA